MVAHSGEISLGGQLGLMPIRRPRTAVPARELSLAEILEYGFPHGGMPQAVAAWRTRNLPNLMRGARRVLAARALKIAHLYGQLSLVVIHPDGSWEDYGLASLRVVTDAGVAAIVDAFQNTVELETFKYHGTGSGGTAEAAAQTALVTEFTTQLNPDSTRPTGSLTEGATANIFRTVGTNTYDATVAITEHGIFTQAATGGGTMLDRSLFSVINLASGDSLQTTYDLTFTSGG